MEQNQQEIKPNSQASADFSNFYTKPQVPQAESVQSSNKKSSSLKEFIQAHKKLFAITFSIILYVIIMLMFIFGNSWFMRRTPSSPNSMAVPNDINR